MRSPIFLITAVVLAMASPAVHALDVDDDQLVRAVSLMQNEQWELAYAVFTEVDDAEQASGVSQGVYGKLLFSMGLCQMELAKAAGAGDRKELYQNALKDFARCRHFIGSPDDQNAYVSRSLLRMGMCYQALELFAAAHAAYSKFLLERNQISDVYDNGNLLLNLVRCALHLSSAADDETFAYLQQAMDGRERYKISSAPLGQVMLDVYAALASRVSPEQEQLLLAWLTELVPDLVPESEAILAAVSHAAQKLSDAGKIASAASLLQILPWIPADRAAELDFSNFDGFAPTLMARTIEQFADTQPAQQRGALFGQLLEQFPQSTRVSEWLYRLVVAHFELDQIEQARAAAAQYESRFPDGASRNAIELLVLAYLFDAGKYPEALTLAEANLVDPELQTQERLYVMVGSTCFLADYQRCLSLAGQYLKRFPDGEFASSVHYFQAVSYARLGYLAKARAALAEVTTGDAQDHAQYELAMLDFEAASYQQVQIRLAAMKNLDLVPALQVQLDLLAARTSAVLREREAAESSYLAALSLARSSQLLDLEQEVLFYLIAFYGRENVAGEPNLEMEKCLPYYDAFFQKFANSAYAPQVASVAIPALTLAGELERGIKTLQLVLQSASSASKEAGVRNAARTLIWAKIDSGIKLSELKLEFEAHPPSRFALVQWFALAEVYAAGLEQAHLTWGRKLRYDAILRGIYAELSLRAKTVALPSYIDLALAEWYLTDENFPHLARGHFESALESELIGQRMLASLGLAKSLRISATLPDLQHAQRILSELLERTQDDMPLLEKSMCESIEVLSQLESWDILTERAKSYLIENKFDYQRSRVWYLLAKSYDLRGLSEDAMANYSRVFAGYTRVLAVSAPSVARLSELTWLRNHPKTAEQKADRQIAYQLAHRYLSMVKDYPEWERQRIGIRDSLAAIGANVAAWEASGEVISVEQMLKEMRQGKR